MNYDKDYADDIRAAKMLAASTPIGAAEAYVQAGGIARSNRDEVSKMSDEQYKAWIQTKIDTEKEAYVQAGIGQITAQQGPVWIHTTPADIACPASAVEQLDKRIMVEGYALQRLEEIRRDLREFGLDKVEPLVNEAIEVLAVQWLFDRKSYRDQT